MKSAVLLGRVSRGERTQDPEGQLGPLRATAERLGVEVRREVVFAGKSAWSDVQAREVWRAIEAALIESEADTLMVWALDRMTRGGIEDAFAKVRTLEEHHGVGFYSLQEPFLSTATAHGEARELMLALMAWAAKWESTRKSERLRAKVEAKKRDAAKLGQRALWGRGHVPLPEDVAEFGRLRGEGLTFRQVGERTGFGTGTVYRALKARSNPPPHPGAGSAQGEPARSTADEGTGGEGA